MDGLRSGAREVFWVRQDGETHSTLPSIYRVGYQETGRGSDHGCAASVWHARVRCFGSGRRERPGLLDPIQDPLVLDLELGIALGLLAHFLPVGVVLPGIGRDIGQDGHLVDVWIILGVYIFQFRMKSFIAGAGEAGISFGDLDEGISGMEVGVVVIPWQPAGCGVGYFVGLR